MQTKLRQQTVGGLLCGMNKRSVFNLCLASLIGVAAGVPAVGVGLGVRDSYELAMSDADLALIAGGLNCKCDTYSCPSSGSGNCHLDDQGTPETNDDCCHGDCADEWCEGVDTGGRCVTSTDPEDFCNTSGPNCPPCTKIKVVLVIPCLSAGNPNCVCMGESNGYCSL